MAYTFKKLAEVEEIQKVPETAKAFVEVDGEVKRAPYGAGGGGAKINDLRFDLDFEEVVEGSNTYVNFTNMDQIKKVLDDDMNIVILYRTSSCCGVNVGILQYFRCNTTAKPSGTNVFIPCFGRTYSYNENSQAIIVTFETEERLTPVSAKFRVHTDYEILAVYATI